MRVLAIDPGEKVGWAHGTVSPQTVDPASAASTIEVTGHGISTLKDFALKFIEVVDDYDVVIYETYRISPAKVKHHIGSDVPTLQLIGMIRLCAWLNPQVKLVGQPPAAMATADKTMPPEIKAIIDKLPKAHDESHDGSALRHLWKWFWKEYV